MYKYAKILNGMKCNLPNFIDDVKSLLSRGMFHKRAESSTKCLSPFLNI